jgi:hypothetical protein
MASDAFNDSVPTARKVSVIGSGARLSLPGPERVSPSIERAVPLGGTEL